MLPVRRCRSLNLKGWECQVVPPSLRHRLRVALLVSPCRERGAEITPQSVCRHVHPPPPANTHNPKFVRLIRIRYKFEEVQTVTVRLYDIDSKVSGQADTLRLADQDFIGEVSC